MEIYFELTPESELLIEKYKCNHKQIVVHYYKSGKIEKICSFIGKSEKYLDDDLVVFSEESGLIIKKEKYTNGTKNGKFTYYYNDGKLKKVGSFVDGLLNGLKISYT